MRSVGLRRSAHGLENRFVAISQRQADWMIREVVPFSLGRARESRRKRAVRIAENLVECRGAVVTASTFRRQLSSRPYDSRERYSSGTGWLTGQTKSASMDLR